MSSTEIYGLVALVAIGVALLAFGLGRWSAPHKDAAELKRALTRQEKECAEYRQQVEAHFLATAELLQQMQQQNEMLYDHMAKQGALLAKSVELKYPSVTDNMAIESTKQSELPPRDYAGGASGLLKKQID